MYSLLFDIESYLNIATRVPHSAMNVTQKPHLHQDWIDPHANGIVRALQKNGFMTYLVGGCVRENA